MQLNSLIGNKSVTSLGIKKEHLREAQFLRSKGRLSFRSLQKQIYKLSDNFTIMFFSVKMRRAGISHHLQHKIIKNVIFSMEITAWTQTLRKARCNIT